MRAVAGREATRTTNDAIKGCGPYGTPTSARAPVGCLHTSFLEKTLQFGVSGANAHVFARTGAAYGAHRSGGPAWGLRSSSPGPKADGRAGRLVRGALALGGERGWAKPRCAPVCAAPGPLCNHTYKMLRPPPPCMLCTLWASTLRASPGGRPALVRGALALGGRVLAHLCASTRMGVVLRTTHRIGVR